MLSSISGHPTVCYLAGDDTAAGRVPPDMRPRFSPASPVMAPKRPCIPCSTRVCQPLVVYPVEIVGDIAAAQKADHVSSPIVVWIPPCIFILSRKTSTAHDPNGGLFFHASPHTVGGRLADSMPLREERTRSGRGGETSCAVSLGHHRWQRPALTEMGQCMCVLVSAYGLCGCIESVVARAVGLRALGAEECVCARPDAGCDPLVMRGVVPVGVWR
jgi:hypothetical protein